MINPLFIANVAAAATSQFVERDEPATTHSAPISSGSSALRSKTESIEFDIEKIFMITEALWNILKEEHGYSDEILVQKIQDVDLRDGKLDGRVAKSPERSTCPHCNRVMIKNRKCQCLYCGAMITLKPFER